MQIRIIIPVFIVVCSAFLDPVIKQIDGRAERRHALHGVVRQGALTNARRSGGLPCNRKGGEARGAEGKGDGGIRGRRLGGRGIQRHQRDRVGGRGGFFGRIHNRIHQLRRQGFAFLREMHKREGVGVRIFRQHTGRQLNRDLHIAFGFNGFAVQCKADIHSDEAVVFHRFAQGVFQFGQTLGILQPFGLQLRAFRQNTGSRLHRYLHAVIQRLGSIKRHSCFSCGRGQRRGRGFAVFGFLRRVRRFRRGGGRGGLGRRRRGGGVRRGGGGRFCGGVRRGFGGVRFFRKDIRLRRFRRGLFAVRRPGGAHQAERQAQHQQCAENTFFHGSFNSSLYRSCVCGGLRLLPGI